LTDQLDQMTAPALATDADRTFAGVVRTHFDELVRHNPIAATTLGIHSEDHRLPSFTRAAVDEQTDIERRYLHALERIDAGELSPSNRVELELATLCARRELFDAEVHRLWERRPNAADQLGDALFPLFARDFAPLSERLESIRGRLEAAPRALTEVRERVGDRPERLWLEIEAETADRLPSFIDEVVQAGAAMGGPSPGQQALERAATTATAALADYAEWVRGELPRAVEAFPLGRERFDALVDLRAFDSLSTDAILAIGEEQLALNHERRREAAREIDPDGSETDVLERIKRDHPPTFDEALDAYREVMDRAREFIIERDLATLPSLETLEVIPTPEYLRRVLPFAAYFPPSAFDLPRKGIYVVTPSVDNEPGAMREHNWASISNTSIHEAYPGHHHQLSAALERPTITRLLIDAPEFVEGWGMYCEQLMREYGFDATPSHRVILATDAIWRACRIILDVRLHRGEIGVPEAIDFLIGHTGFERANAEAEVQRYTSTPTYQLSYLLGKVLLLRLREDERRRLGDDFSLKAFHDGLLWSGSIPISFHRRLLAGEGGGPFRPSGGNGDIAGDEIGG
jgi:uncharacterized protein (DUF885 family)